MNALRINVSSWFKRLGPFLGVVFFLMTATRVYFKLEHFKYADSLSALSSTSSWVIGQGVILTLLNHLISSRINNKLILNITNDFITNKSR
ncbi:MAG: uncharacterized membrane protein YbhN (UPF0104 family) [Colwellia sp.]|jgi:uncharacterized membrane protein YbhN (UPF0104 family)